MGNTTHLEQMGCCLCEALLNLDDPEDVTKALRELAGIAETECNSACSDSEADEKEAKKVPAVRKRRQRSSRTKKHAPSTNAGEKDKTLVVTEETKFKKDKREEKRWQRETE